MWKRIRNKRQINVSNKLLKKIDDNRGLSTDLNSNKENLFVSLPVTDKNLLIDDSYANVVETFKNAGRQKRLVLLEYITEHLIFDIRLIEVYSFRKTLAGNILLYAWSYKSDAIRSYRLDRVVSAMLSRASYTPRYTIEMFF